MTTYQFHVFLSFIWIIIFFCFLIFNYLITKKVRITFSMIQAIITYIIVLGSIQLIHYIEIHYF
nr:MAG TPA: hypothetical protein [Crassvirales sp.]